MAFNVMAPIRAGAIPTGAAIIGSMGSESLLDSVSTGRGVLFGRPTDHLQNAYKSFMENVVRPIKETAVKVYNAVSSFLSDTTYIDIHDNNALITIPPSMRQAIMMDERFRALLADERIYGYGYTESMLPEEDYYGRMIDNGKAKDLQPGDEAWLRWHFKSTDPHLTTEELWAIEDTRNWIFDNFIGEAFYDDTPITNDPTDIDNFRLTITEAELQ